MRTDEREFFDDNTLQIDTEESRTFTVSELRTALEAYPPDTLVAVFGFDGGGSLIDLIHHPDNRRLAIVGDR